MGDEKANNCLTFVTMAAAVPFACMALFGAMYLYSLIADPNLRTMPDEYGNPISPEMNFGLAGGILFVGLVIVIKIFGHSGKQYKESVPQADWEYSYECHFWRPGDTSWGTRKGASWTEGWDAEPPEKFMRAVTKIKCTDPMRTYDDAVVVKSYVENRDGKVIIHDGVLTYATMQEVTGAPIFSSIKKGGKGVVNPGFVKGFEVAWNEVDEWRVRK